MVTKSWTNPNHKPNERAEQKADGTKVFTIEREPEIIKPLVFTRENPTESNYEVPTFSHNQK